MPTLAKLTRPKVHRALHRERLFERLDESRECPLVWVVSPPGAGKTTLVASYVEARKIPSIWYQLDAGDDDIGSFFYYLAQALPASRAKRAPPLPILTPEYRGNHLAFSRLYFRELFARLPSRSVLALDNYHELPEESQLHGVLAQAVAEVPEGCNILSVSRSEPPRELLPLRLTERLATLDWSLLRLSLDETRAIAATRGGDVDDPTLREIHRVSDGWAAGVALTLQRAHELRETPAQGGREAIADLFDYFAAQVLRAAPHETQRFLARTALLPSMTAATAERMSGRADSEQVLEDLYRRGVFTTRRNTRPAIYQYHDLFRAFLLDRLEASLPAADFVGLQRQAAALLEEGGHRDHAIRLHLAAADHAAARRLILEAAPALISQGRGASLKDWIAALPRELAESDPQLCYWLGASLSRVDPAQARPPLERAFHAFAQHGSVMGQRLACAELMLTYLYEFASFQPLDRWTPELLRLLADPEPFPSPTVELMVRTSCLFALSFRQPDADAVDACVARMMELLTVDVPPELVTVAGGVLLLHLYVVGDTQRCTRVAARLKTLHESAEISPHGRAVSLVQIGHADLRCGEPAVATSTFGAALDVAAAHAITLPTVHVYSHLGLAFCALLRGDLERADAHRKKIEEHWIPGRRTDEVASMRVQLWTACYRGHWDTALRLALRQRELADACGFFMLAFESRVQLALVHAEGKRRRECSEALAPVREQIAGTCYGHFAYQIDLVEAYAALIAGGRDAAHARLRTGVDGSRKDDSQFLLRMHPTILPRLYAEALTSRIDTEYVVQKIRQLDLRAPSTGTPGWPWPLRIYTLGRFEVLRDGQPLEFSRKAPRKTLALLKAIIAYGGRNVREQLLLDAFWSEEEGDAAARSLTAALHRLRALLGDNEAVLQQGGTLSLDATRVWVDAWALEGIISSAHSDGGELLELYRGGFLVEDEGEPWSVTMRERLRSRFIHALAARTQDLESADRFEEAIEHYLRGLDADPVIEQFYQGLMRCYARLDRRSEAVAAYRRLRQILSVSLSLKPSPGTEKLYRSLRLDQTGA